jgi:hypothetical protein
MKFVLENIQKKILEKAVSVRKNAIDNLQDKGVMGINVIYSTYYYALNGYLTGQPTKWQVRAFPYVIVGVDNKDNQEYVQKLKAIHKKAKRKQVFVEQDFELLKEVLKWFEDNCFRDTGKVLSVLGKDFDDHSFNKTYKKLKKTEKGVFK